MKPILTVVTTTACLAATLCFSGALNAYADSNKNSAGSSVPKSEGDRQSLTPMDASKHHPANGEHWNRFRGPNGQGVAQADRIPVHFGPDSNVLWKTVVPAGHSSPVIWDNRIFLTASEPANRKELITLAVDREEGKILWRQAVQAEIPGRFHPLNNPASSTPAADDKHVYVYFGTYGLAAQNRHAAKQVWNGDLAHIVSGHGDPGVGRRRRFLPFAGNP